MTRIVAIILGALLLAANAQTVRLGQFLHPKDDTERAFNHLYLAGVRDGPSIPHSDRAKSRWTRV
jgi:hypothetical protein